jgi:predicted esterase
MKSPHIPNYKTAKTTINNNGIPNKKSGEFNKKITSEIEVQANQNLNFERYSSVPMFFQTDFQDSPYGEHGTIASHGCGITCVAMVASYLLDRYISPRDLAIEFESYNTESGSKWSLFPDSAKKLGLEIEKQTSDWDEIIEALKEGKVAIAGASKGSLFTDGGHFIVLTGLTKDGKIIVNDPYKGNYTKDERSNIEKGFTNGFNRSDLYKCNPCWIYAPKDKTQIANSNPVTVSNLQKIEDNENFCYYLYTPSSISHGDKVPLIIYLHDYWGSMLDEVAFTNSEFSKLLRNWPLEPINAYVVFPKLSRGLRSWGTNSNKEKIEKTIENLTNIYNIDTSKIIIIGRGIGGEGCLYFASKNPDLFSAALVFSPYNRCNVRLQDIKTPTKIFIGNKDFGEEGECLNTIYKLKKYFGEENVFTIKTSHAEILREIILTDKNKNITSDILEWALAQ